MILQVSRILIHLRMVFLFFCFMWEILAFASLSGNVSGPENILIAGVFSGLFAQFLHFVFSEHHDMIVCTNQLKVTLKDVFLLYYAIFAFPETVLHLFPVQGPEKPVPWISMHLWLFSPPLPIVQLSRFLLPA